MISFIVYALGLALLQKNGNLPDLQTDLMEAPYDLMQEAAILHPFAEACYTVSSTNPLTLFLLSPASSVRT
jgi:hypothetical protein